MRIEKEKLTELLKKWYCLFFDCLLSSQGIRFSGVTLYILSKTLYLISRGGVFDDAFDDACNTCNIVSSPGRYNILEEFRIKKIIVKKDNNYNLSNNYNNVCKAISTWNGFFVELSDNQLSIKKTNAK